MKKLFAPFIALSLIAASCTKENTTPLGREGMLRTGRWKISSSKVRLKLPNGKYSTINYGPYRKACITDNYLKFDSLNRGAIHNGGISCSVASPDSVGFIWSLKNNGNNIDILNCFTLIDSVKQFVYIDANGIYQVGYDSASSYVSNIYNGVLSSFSQSSFVLEYPIYAQYPDTTAAKGGSAAAPVILPDTFHFMITYTNY
ncbi:MAG: hypothetical protein H7257_13425 [Taibaiella sp.]|nr:hypothetical protein [Taibaiella sp.]